MICPECGGNISGNSKKCKHCNVDLELTKKIISLSNAYYNIALERAKVRDLSGAVNVLKDSLKLNKKNDNARNLLGLIYYEMGETVNALSEWVISKHFKAEHNDADRYISAIQKNPSGLESLNQTIKRYNAALESAKLGNDDVAIIQLKKVTSLNPNYINAFLLIALLYMKNGDNNKAKKYLYKAKKIDVTNTKTLRYLQELKLLVPPSGEQGRAKRKEDGEVSIVPISSYKEDKPNIIAFVNLVIGVIIGIAVTSILVIPTIKRDYEIKSNNDYTQYSAGLAKQQEQDDTIRALQDDKEVLEKEVKDLRDEIDNIEIPEIKDELVDYEPLFAAVTIYIEELAKAERDRDLIKIADKVSLIDENEIKSDEAKALVKEMKEVTYQQATATYYRSGHDLYSAKKYDEALKELEKAFIYDQENVDAIYFIGRSYHQLGDTANAALYYNMLIDDYPNTERAKLAKEQVAAIG